MLDEVQTAVEKSFGCDPQAPWNVNLSIIPLFELFFPNL